MAMTSGCELAASMSFSLDMAQQLAAKLLKMNKRKLKP
jgi:hypothetical protein